LALVNTALLGARTARRARRKNIKIAPAYAKASAGRQKKSVFSPPLIFSFLKRNKQYNARKIKDL
jgi:hypothetical protein